MGVGGCTVNERSRDLEGDRMWRGEDREESRKISGL